MLGSALSPQTSTATPNYWKNVKHAGDAQCTARGSAARDEIVVGGKRRTCGTPISRMIYCGVRAARTRSQEQWLLQNRSERGEQSGHPGCRPRDLDTWRPDPARRTGEPGRAPPAAAWMAHIINADAESTTETKPSTSTIIETSADTDA